MFLMVGEARAVTIFIAGCGRRLVGRRSRCRPPRTDAIMNEEEGGPTCGLFGTIFKMINIGGRFLRKEASEDLSHGGVRLEPIPVALQITVNHATIRASTI